MIKSKLKFWPLLLLLFVNACSGALFYSIFIKAGRRVLEFEFWKDASLIWLLIISLEVFALSLIFQLKTIIIKSDKIIFINFLLPFIKKEKLFSHYDFSTTVMEESKSKAYESVWLFKNGRLENQISSFYYSNYAKLKFNIKVKSHDQLEIDIIKQIYYKLGGKL